jgi:hypothetical protein
MHRRFLAANLTIEFDEQDPGLCHKTQIYLEDIGVHPDFYFRFYIENKGKSMAKHCEIVAEKLWHKNSQEQNYHPYNQFAPMNLNWTGGEKGIININPKRKVAGNIGHIPAEDYQNILKKLRPLNLIDLIGNEEKNKLRFFLDLTQSFFAFPNCLAHGEYYIQIGLYSENAKDKKLYFEILWTGIWKDDPSAMFEQIKIEKRYGPPNMREEKTT